MIPLKVALRHDAELAADECRDWAEEVNEKAFAVHEKAFGTMLMRLYAETYAPCYTATIHPWLYNTTA